MDKALGKTPVKKPTCIKDNIIQASLKEDPGGRDDISSPPKTKDNLSRSDKKLGMGEDKIAMLRQFEKSLFINFC